MWIKIEANPAKGLVEQYVKRANGLTVASLRRDKHDHEWIAFLLEYGGISSRAVSYEPSLTVTEAKERVRQDLKEMGWIW